MNISVNSQVHAMDLNALIGQLGATGETQATQASSTVTSTGMNVVLTDEQGNVIQGNLGLPELDGQDALPLSEEAMTGMVDNLQQLVNSFQVNAKATTGAAQGTNATEQKGVTGEVAARSGSVTNDYAFSISELMTLVNQCSKELKAAAKESRNNSLANELTAIQAQADYTREAGMYGMILGITFGVVQTAMSVVSTGISISKDVQQLNMVKNDPQVALTKTDLTMTQNAQNTQASQAQLQQAGSSLSPEQKGAVEQYFNEANQAKTDYNNVANPNDGAEPDQAVIAQKSEAARSAYDQAMSAYDDAIADKQTQVDNLKAIKNPTQEQTDQLTQAESELKSLQDGRSYAKALQLDGKAHVSTQVQLQADLNVAHVSHDNAIKSVENRTEYRTLGISAKKADLVAAGANQLSGIFNGITQAITSGSQAEGTEEQAKEKQAEADRQAANDMVSAAQDLANSVLKLAAAIVEIEASTNQKIIQG